MSKKILTTPIRSEDLEDIRIGDIIYLNGYLITARDCAHTRLVKHGRKIPVDLAGKAIFHAGPIMVPDQTSGSGFKVVSIGPTTSMRMEKFEKEFIEQTGVKLIVGKGGMGPNTVEGCTRFKALHCVFPGGCAVLAVQGCTDGIEALSGLDYETLDGGARLYEVPAEVMSGIMDAWQTAYPMQVYAPQEASAADSGNACILLLP